MASSIHIFTNIYEINFKFQTDLIHFIILSLILSSKVEEELLCVPVEQRCQIGIQVKAQGSQVVLLSRNCILWHILPIYKRKRFDNL